MNQVAYVEGILSQMEQHAPNILGECIARHAATRDVDQSEMWHGDLRDELKKSVERVFELWLNRSGLDRLGYRAEVILQQQHGQFQLNVYRPRLFI